MSQPGQTVVALPAYNEAANLPGLLARWREVLEASGAPYRIVVVDDGSSDETPELLARLAATQPFEVVTHACNQGLGRTITDALATAAHAADPDDLIVTMDADGTHPPELFPRMADKLAVEGVDVVIASRYQPGSLVKGVPFHRRLLSSVASILFRLAFPIAGVKDFTCGYRAYRSGVLKAAFDRYGDDLVSEDGFQCMVDLLLKLRKMNLIFREVPLILRYDVKEGASKMKIMQTIFRTIGLMFRRWFRR